ncbi:conserved hypothetical protein [Ricinus communis]|uniref:Uncharacterized protein n=1 Tax=Ricinus communis TaxID=3988 RepID=B9T5Q0_RICCO|nr:conserved hypothetical protein [Ricinus communis]
MVTAFVSRSCICNCQRSSVVERKELPMPPSSCVIPACRKLDGVASWLLNGVAAVFFSSLERCYCMYIDTVDDSDDFSRTALISIKNRNGNFRAEFEERVAETEKEGDG